jgi:hypothetical protein
MLEIYLRQKKKQSGENPMLIRNKIHILECLPIRHVRNERKTYVYPVAQPGILDS